MHIYYSFNNIYKIKHEWWDKNIFVKNTMKTINRECLPINIFWEPFLVLKTRCWLCRTHAHIVIEYVTERTLPDRWTSNEAFQDVVASLTRLVIPDSDVNTIGFDMTANWEEKNNMDYFRNKSLFANCFIFLNRRYMRWNNLLHLQKKYIYFLLA